MYESEDTKALACECRPLYVWLRRVTLMYNVNKAGSPPLKTAPIGRLNHEIDALGYFEGSEISCCMKASLLVIRDDVSITSYCSIYLLKVILKFTFQAWYKFP